MGDYKETGVLTLEDIVKPSADRVEKGPVVVVECIENIPCDPCVAACFKEAISMDEITDIPNVDFEGCIGCGVCVTECPGLAIFIIDCTSDPCTVTVPYEYLPVPEKGDIVYALDRKGNIVQESEVIRIRSSGKTYGVTISVDKKNIWDVRGVEVKA